MSWKLAGVAAVSMVSVSAALSEDIRPADILPRGQILDRTRDDYAAAVNACPAHEPLESPAFTACMKDAVLTADADVNAAYAEALRIIVPARRAELAKAQEAWLAFYRLNCDLEKPLALSAYYDCVVKMAIERAAELRNRIGD